MRPTKNTDEAILSVIFPEEDQKKIISLINESNSNKVEKEKIGYNKKYRVVKCPENYVLSLRDERRNLKKIAETFIKEKKSQSLIEEKNIQIKEEYEKKNLKEIKRLKNILMELDEEYEELNIQNKTKENKINEIKVKIDEENRKSSLIIKQEAILRDLENEHLDLNNNLEKKIMLQNLLFDNEVYFHRKENIDNKNKKSEKFVCICCKERCKEVFYCDCFHLTFCKECYNNMMDKYVNRCPLCKKCNSLVIKVSY